MNRAITILPLQAEKLAEVTAQTGTAIGVSQQGSVLTLYLGNGGQMAINSRGEEIPQPQEPLC